MLPALFRQHIVSLFFWWQPLGHVGRGCCMEGRMTACVMGVQLRVDVRGGGCPCFWALLYKFVLVKVGDAICQGVSSASCCITGAWCTCLGLYCAGARPV